MGAPDVLFALWLLIWGATVAGDLPQFPALTASNAPPLAVGSVLTLVNSIAFAISIVGVQLFVSLAQSHDLAWMLPWQGIGPLLSVWAMRPLWRRRVRQCRLVVGDIAQSLDHRRTIARRSLVRWFRNQCQQCSVRSRSPPAGVLTVSAIKPTFDSATCANPSGSNTRFS